MSVPVATGLTDADLAAMPEPDVVFLGPDRAAQLEDPRYVEGVPEFWFVDLDEDVIDVDRLDDTGRDGTPTTLGPADTLTCAAAPGSALRVPDVLA